MTRPGIVTLLASSALLLAACGGGGDDGARQGVTTRTPGPEATATASRTPRPTATAPALPTQPPPPLGEPDAVALALAALGTGGDAAVIAGWLDIVGPRCTQTREELGPLVERGWRFVNEELGFFIPVASMLGRLDAGLPPSGRVNCDARIAAIVTELRSR